MEGSPVYYAWGFGGQMIYVAPEEKLTVVITSDDNRPSARTGHLRKLHALMGEIVAAARESETESELGQAEE